MKKLHVFVALLGMLLPVVALAGKVPAAAVVKPQSAMKPGSYTQAAILNPKLSCGSPSNSAFNADIKNTGTVTASYTPTLVITEPGECTKMEQGKNPDGSPCKPGQLLCPGHCASYGPDKNITYTPTPTTMSIAAGATMHLHISVANRIMKKAKINVLEQGKSSSVNKPVAIIPPCIF